MNFLTVLTVGDFTSEIFNEGSGMLSGIISFITTLFTNVIGVFYNSTDGITDIGKLMLLGLVISAVWFGFRFIRRLVKLR